MNIRCRSFIFALSGILLVFLLGTCRLFAADYFWVGGTGNWTDTLHWVTVSGGSVNRSTPPTSNDRVYFDSLSFSSPGQILTIDTSAAFCKDMVWNTVTNNPTILGAAGDTIHVYGSLIFAAAMTNSFAGILYFNSSGSDSIDINGTGIIGPAVFNGQGSWKLQSDFSASTIVLERGNLSTDNFLISTVSFQSPTSVSRSLDLGTSVINISGSDTAWLVQSAAFNLDADSCILNFLYTGAIPLIFYAGDSLDYHKVRFLGANINIYDPGKYDTLRFASGSVISLEGGTTHEVKVLDANGNCGAFVQFNSTSPGVQAMLKPVAGGFAVDFVKMIDTKGVTPGTFIATNSIDQGNNTNWTITEPAGGSTLFWINGDGNWSDTTHWSGSSGGSISGCIPGPADDVVFDLNSFGSLNDTVLVDEPAYCNNMTWTGVTNNPVFAGNSYDIRIRGSLTFDAPMTAPFSANYLLEGNSQDTIVTNGVLISGHFDLEGTGGQWTMGDNLTSSKEIRLREGIFKTDNNQLTVSALLTIDSANKTVNIGSSAIFLTGDSMAWDLSSSNTSFSSNGSPITFNSGSETMSISMAATLHTTHFSRPLLTCFFLEITHTI